jgi:hypothetical protein
MELEFPYARYHHPCSSIRSSLSASVELIEIKLGMLPSPALFAVYRLRLSGYFGKKGN